jgi:hypothetical protein
MSVEDEVEMLKRAVGKLTEQLASHHDRLEAQENPATALKFLGVGTVVSDKNDGSKNLMVHLQEEFPTVEGEISPLHQSTEYTGTDLHGNEYKHTLQHNTSVKCVWKEVPNRLTAPDIRQGEQVEVYQAGDGDKLYWSEMGRQKGLRRAERVCYAFNASGAETSKDEPVIPHNQYVFDVNPKGGNITVSTSKDNGEHCKYTAQADGKNGHWLVEDDLGNHFSIDSKLANILFQTAKGGLISAVGKDVVLKGGTLHLDFERIVLNGVTEVTKELTTKGVKNSGDIKTDTLGNTPLGNYKH